MTKQLDQLEAKLGGVLLDNLSAEASTPLIRISFFDSDNPTVSRTPDASTLKFCLDPENTQGKQSEWFRCESHSTTNGITTCVNNTRGLQRDATVDLTGSASRAQAWDASTTPVGVATEPHNLNLLRKMMLGTEQVTALDVANTLEVDGITTLNDKVQLSDAATYIDNVGGDMAFKDTNNSLTTLSDLTAAAGTDTKARVSANDTTSGFLNGKLVAGDNITFTENNDGGNETLTIAAPSSTKYGIDSVGTDSYAVTLSPAISAYSDGQLLSFEAGTANTGASTVNFNSLGAIPIKKGDYFDTITGDIPEDGTIKGTIKVKAVTFTGAFTGGETSGTLTGNWGYKTGTYSVKFSNGDRKDVTLTKGATSATWSGGLSGAATVNAEAQWFIMHTPSAALVGNNDASDQHYHNFITNASHLRRREFTGNNLQGTAGGTTTANNGVVLSVITAASDNSLAAWYQNTTDVASVGNPSVHNKSPAFRVPFSFVAATAQEGFIGFVNNSFTGTSLENAVLTLDHFGFLIADGTTYISVADGTTQQKTDISATLTNVTTGYIVSATFDGTTAKFYVNDDQVGSDMTTNVPNGTLTRFVVGAIADASAAAKTAYFGTDLKWSYNET